MKQPSNTYPVFIVSGAVLQQVLQLDGAVGHKVIVSDGCVVENGQLQTPSLADLGAELLVPGGAVGLGLRGSLAEPGLVEIEGQVGVQEEGAALPHCVTQGPRGGLQVHCLTHSHLQ